MSMVENSMVPAADYPAAGGGASAYLHALRRRWWVAIGLGLACAGTLIPVVWLAMPPQYTATSLLRVATTEQQLVFNTAERTTAGTFEIYKNTQLQLFASEYVLLAAMRNEEVSKLASRRDEADPVAWLSEKIQIDFPGEAEIMRVRFTENDPKAAAAVVNAVVDAYLSEIVDVERNRRRTRLNELDRLYTDKEGEMRTKRTDLKRLAEQLGTGDSGALALKQQIALEQYAELRKEMVRLQFEERRQVGQLKVQETRRGALPKSEIAEVEIDAFARTDPVASELIARQSAHLMAVQAARERATASAVGRFAGTHEQALQELQKKLDTRRQELRAELVRRRQAEIDAQIAALQAQIAVLDEQAKALAVEVDASRKQAERFGGSSIDVEMMRAEIDHLNTVLTAIAEERERLKVELRSGGRVSVVQRADTPRTPDLVQKIQLAAVVGILGFGLPLAGVVFWDVSGRRISTPDEISTAVGLPVLGSVPLLPAKVMALAGPVSPRSLQWRTRLDEAVNGIVARLLREAREGGTRVLLISSAASGEGKTTLATQLSASLARAGHRTLLVDFDLRRPAIDRVFHLPPGPGVWELLTGESTLEQVLRESGSENLWIITSGGGSPSSLEMLAGGRLAGLFAGVRRDFEFVIVDGSPILPVADARLVSQHADAVILSVLRDVSRAPMVLTAVKTLAAFGVCKVGAVMIGSTEEVYGRAAAPRPAA